MSKKSLRFFNDREVRALLDDENSCWWFSATDVVPAINDEQDYTTAGNYWCGLKHTLGQEGVELVSPAHGFKYEARDGKQRKADVLNSEMVDASCHIVPTIFLDRINTFGWQSRKKAYILFENEIHFILQICNKSANSSGDFYAKRMTLH